MASRKRVARGGDTRHEAQEEGAEGSSSSSEEARPLPLASLPEACMQQVVAQLDAKSRHTLFSTCHALRQAVLSCAARVEVTPSTQGCIHRVNKRLKAMAQLLALPPGPACMQTLSLTLQRRHMQLLPMVSALQEGRVQELDLEVGGHQSMDHGMLLSSTTCRCLSPVGWACS